MRPTAPAVLLLGLALSGPAAAQAVVDAESNFNMGLTHLRENRPTLALEQFKQAVKLDGKNPYFQKGLGIAYMQLGKFSEAVSPVA